MPEKRNSETEAILKERFGGDSIIALATMYNGKPDVRNVDAIYNDGAFYVITHAATNKMKQIAADPAVAIAGEWFTAHGTGTNMGWFCSPENAEISQKLRTAFAAWIDNGHNNFSDRNTIILRIALTDGILFANGTRHEIDFTPQ